MHRIGVGRKPKLGKYEEKLGDNFRYLLCGLLNMYGFDETARFLSISPTQLREYLQKKGIVKMWVVLDDFEEFERKITKLVDEL